MLDDGIRLRVDGKAYELMLFQKHFLVMNALYRLQIQLLEDQEIYLSISPLLIKLEPMVHRCNTELLADYGDAKLSEYYLDWNNFDQSLTDVKTLLDDFWKRYFAGEQRAVIRWIALRNACNFQQTHDTTITRYGN